MASTGIRMKWRVGAGIILILILAISLGWNKSGVWRGSFNSLDHIGQACVNALNRGDADALHRLRVSRDEFLSWIWHEFPAAHPPNNFPGDFAWANLNKQSVLGLRKSLRTHGGKDLTFVDLRFEELTEKYNGFTLLRGSVLTVRTPNGNTLELRILGSVVKKAGQYKLLSFKE